MKPKLHTLVHITTIPMSFWLFKGQPAFMQAHGYEVHAVASSGELMEKFAQTELVQTHVVEMHRAITPLQDLVAIYRLCKLLRQIRPDIVHAHTPKGGLLGTIAARLACVPICIYQMHGLPFMTASGKKRHLLRWSEKLAAFLSHRVIAESHSIREIALAEGICQREKISVIHNGSANGVDAKIRFSPASVAGAGVTFRQQHQIPLEAHVIGFVGRVVRDKGIIELSEAWQILREHFPMLHLIIVGPIEAQDPVPENILNGLKNDSRVHFTGWQDDLPMVYDAMDLFVLPTYREGFNISLMEAQAMQLPVVATRVAGCIDPIQADVTGTLVPPYNSKTLAKAIWTYLKNPALAKQHGQAGRERMLRDFQPEAIWEALYQEYVSLLHRKQTYTIKRWLDVCLAGLALLTLSPLIATLAFVIIMTMGKPVMFRQTRTGLGGKTFTLFKFRTMNDMRDSQGNLLPDNARLTWLGQFLRQTSLDELPELLNVLKGDMSLVGPRPLLPQYLAHYSPEQFRRHEVLPGVTGWAQINGRNGLTWEEKFALDIWYVDHQSLGLDLQILWRTLGVVLRQNGISHENSSTMPEFIGNEP